MGIRIWNKQGARPAPMDVPQAVRTPVAFIGDRPILVSRLPQLPPPPAPSVELPDYDQPPPITGTRPVPRALSTHPVQAYSMLPAHEAPIQWGLLLMWATFAFFTTAATVWAW